MPLVSWWALRTTPSCARTSCPARRRWASRRWRTAVACGAARRAGGAAVPRRFPRQLVATRLASPTGRGSGSAVPPGLHPGLHACAPTGRGIWVAFHAGPLFTDFGFHNTCTPQEEYADLRRRRLSGAGHPRLAERNAAADVYLPPSPAPPRGADLPRLPSAAAPGFHPGWKDAGDDRAPRQGRRQSRWYMPAPLRGADLGPPFPRASPGATRLRPYGARIWVRRSPGFHPGLRACAPTGRGSGSAVPPGFTRGYMPAPLRGADLGPPFPRVSPGATRLRPYGATTATTNNQQPTTNNQQP